MSSSAGPVNATPIDPGRMLRALRLDVAREGPGVYRVSGGEKPHTVRLRDLGGGWSCDCVDATRMGNQCKHVLASILHARLDSPILAALRQVVAGEDGA